MKLIKLILKTIAKIIHFRPYSEWTEEEKIEYAKRQRTFNSSNQSNETKSLNINSKNKNIFGERKKEKRRGIEERALQRRYRWRNARNVNDKVLCVQR